MNKKTSYQGIIEQIKERLQIANPETVSGENWINQVYSSLNESETPILDLKEFITGAEKISKDDVTIKEVIDFCTKKATTGDLHYVINLCKEEHFANLKRAGHPNPKETIKDIQKEFDNPTGIIEQGIKKGIFDRLNSKLLNDVKTGLGVKVKSEDEINQDLNESFQEQIDGLCQYTPIGVFAETPESDNVVILCEHDVLQFNKATNNFSKITNINYEKLSDDVRNLMECITTASYDPETECFSLNENWDFNVIFDTKSNKLFVLNENTNIPKEIQPEQFRKLLLESVQVYKSQGKQFNEEAYLRDGDRLLMLYENSNLMMKIDNLRVLRNLNENSNKYIIYNASEAFGTDTPEIISISGQSGKLFESFTDMVDCIKNEIGSNVQSLFENEIQSEIEQLKNREQQLNELMQQQNLINQKIEKVRNLKSFAEENSAAMDKLIEQEKLLNKALNENLEAVNELTNEFKLH